MACSVNNKNLPPSPLWGGTDGAAVRVGPCRATNAFAASSESPTLDASHPVPPHKGEGSKARSLVQRARHFRKNLTPQEMRLWQHLRPLRADGYHFRRQAPFRGYFLDFVCFNHRLVVEADGGGHCEDVQAAHDVTRDAVLRRQGFRTLRISNGDINTNMAGVMEAVMTALGEARAVREAP